MKMKILDVVLPALLLCSLPAKGDEKCSIDVIAVLDGSDSISEPDFVKLKNAVTQLADWVHSDDPRVFSRLGAVVYSTGVTESVNLSNNKETLKEKIMGFIHPRDGTTTDKGIMKMNEMFAADKKEGVPQVGIVITDGISKDTDATIKAAKESRDAGIRMVAVGVGNNVDEAELEGIASSQDDVKTITEFSELKALVSKLLKEFCVVDGGWSEWNETVSECSEKCGKGVIYHSFWRTCTNPAPRNGGLDCPGSSMKTEHESCFLVHCPVHGGWTPWQTHSSRCSVTCGEGVETITSTRTCSNPAPQYGGASCSGLTIKSETRACVLDDCPWNPCAGCRYDNGVGYMPDGSDCRNFLQCVDYGVRYYTKTCAAGTYWSQDSLTCTRSTDSCKGEIPTNEAEDDIGAYEAVCDGTTRPVSGDDSRYEQQVPDGKWQVMNCPPGTLWERSNCTCVHGGSVSYESCTPELYIPFTGSVVDRSGKNVQVQNNGVKITSPGRGYFADNTGLWANRFSNTHFGSMVTFSFQMQPIGNSTTRGRAVMSNSHCDEAGSVYIINKGNVLEFQVYNMEGVQHVLEVSYSPRVGVFNYVILKISGGVMKATVDGNSDSKEFEGSILSVHCALHVGQATGYDNFIGFIDNFLVTQCPA